MVNYQTPALDRTFAALADPTRRALLARLDAEESVTVSDLARPFPVSLPAIMKHLDVLSDAGLIQRFIEKHQSGSLDVQPLPEQRHDALKNLTKFKPITHDVADLFEYV